MTDTFTALVVDEVDGTPIAARGETAKAQRTLPIAFLKPNRFAHREKVSRRLGSGRALVIPL